MYGRWGGGRDWGGGNTAWVEFSDSFPPPLPPPSVPKRGRGVTAAGREQEGEGKIERERGRERGGRWGEREGEREEEKERERERGRGEERGDERREGSLCCLLGQTGMHSCIQKRFMSSGLEGRGPQGGGGR